MDYNNYQTLEFRRKVFKLVGAEISITDPKTETVVSFISLAAWRLREDIRVYTNKSKTSEIFRIKARSVIDFAGTYDVFDGNTDDTATPRFNLRRKGLRSTFLRDHWIVNNNDGTMIAQLVETSGPLALFRRWVGLVPLVGGFIDLALAFAPQSYRLADAEDRTIATILRRKNPLIVKLQLDFSQATVAPVDQFIAPGLCALISVLEVDK